MDGSRSQPPECHSSRSLPVSISTAASWAPSDFSWRALFRKRWKTNSAWLSATLDRKIACLRHGNQHRQHHRSVFCCHPPTPLWDAQVVVIRSLGKCCLFFAFINLPWPPFFGEVKDSERGVLNFADLHLLFNLLPILS
ncbi:hypothetical protein AVEN_151863-1 [Araneus ventricosus]|uniref:Uncharacterized protein n=1 Tax=Araneus ventricosus TaxID=182803 RepID=A0A4Y2JL51_ARAVE|nr:hypothetical protein AVEN_151863-1 [Araneus ventricosus]